ncbi:IS4 family transposase [Paraburkholderia youngii]|uniref:IS4 family transposase n=1 Tax=Paraburkholderia youngii TaxID=2782701 RepID=UPI003F5F6A2A
MERVENDLCCIWWCLGVSHGLCGWLGTCAQLDIPGWFLGHKGDGEPGAKTLWIGMQRVMDAVTIIQILREGYDSAV